MATTRLPELVQSQVELLQAGKPLQAFDLYYSAEIVMYDNQKLFASDKPSARAIQAPFIDKAKAIYGNIPEFAIDVEHGLSVIHNKSQFVNPDDQTMQIDGIHWQKWENDLIIEERYFRGDMAQDLLAAGVFLNPALVLDWKL